MSMSATITLTPTISSPTATTLTKPKYNQNQFGGNIGGPCIKNQLFFFFDYEGTRIKQGVLRTSTVPLAERADRRLQPGDGGSGGGELSNDLRPDDVHAGFLRIELPAFANNSVPSGQSRFNGADS